MTHWNDQPIIIAGWGFEVETYNEVSWDRLPDLPGKEFNPEAYFAEFFSTVNFLGDVYIFGGRLQS